MIDHRSYTSCGWLWVEQVENDDQLSVIITEPDKMAFAKKGRGKLLSRSFRILLALMIDHSRSVSGKIGSID